MSTITQQLTHEEGYRLKPYLDSKNKITIGIGRNLTDDGLSPDEVAYLFNNDLIKHAKDLDSKLSWWRSLDTVRQKVLLDMCFNMGIENLLKFKNTLHFVQTKQYHNAKLSMLSSLWAKETGIRATNLATMMDTGIDINF